jgi:pilus assembly protein Flp/PilA
MQKIVSFLKDESGASAAEYALILAIIGAGVGVAVFSLGSAITTKIGGATNCIKATAATASTACKG